MTFKFNKLAVSVALALAAGSANAAIGVGDLVFVYDKETSSAAFDLGINMAQFTAASAQSNGGTIVWDFVNNTVTPTGVSGFTGSATGTWSAAWASIAGGTGTFGVLGLDGDIAKIVTTSISSTAAVNSTTFPDLANTGAVQPYFDALNGLGTHLGNPQGGAFVSAAASPALHNNGFGLSDQWQDTLPSLVALGSSLSPLAFWEMNGPTGSPYPRYAGAFTLNAAAGTLTYEVAAIPEPSTYALLAAGMAVIGVFARRRSA